MTAPALGRTAEPGQVRAALDEVDAVGGFFAVSTRGAEGADPSWRPLARLLAVPADGPDPVGERLDQVAEGLGAGRRVAASLLAQSLASRSVSVLLAAAAGGVLPDLGPASVLHARPWVGGPVPLWADPERLTGTDVAGADPEDVAAALARVLAQDHVAPLVAGIRARASVSPRVLWGNAAASLAGAVRVLGDARPDRHATALALARGVLAREPFAGLGRFVADPAHPSGLGFARTTCCLYYRVPGGGKCGDCVLRV
ncbi:(2Fe-2S)-binding protein [Actinomycetospora cinnamomea]|uniref:Ferric iron reductase FhuF-like transporter n=1 Tax=Actinomycetospora cinnamomea TaxID=663609 RepID=A0A2U1FIT0_9PSEU|nr:(2Fe-2S)-binding protein [Actinomycetospora cinnamomea]PVZ12095.1 ferric iron reductase FhuF-like transporter [Actinomycetospora cinnamomea]